MQQQLFQSELHSVTLLKRGKVRDIYALDDEHLLIVASDRLSAFDVVLPDAIPGKGAVLTALSAFWFARFAELVPNHLSDRALAEFLSPADVEQVSGRAMLVHRLEPLPLEAIVGGYISGAAWQDDQRSGPISGVAPPAGLQQAQQLPAPSSPPSTTAAPGAHDENIDFAASVALLGRDLATQVRDVALAIYQQAVAYARTRGIIVADTKLEFGLDRQGNLVLIDEVLTPDSSRFWPQAQYQVGSSPPSFDKQYVRDYLETLAW